MQVLHRRPRASRLLHFAHNAFAQTALSFISVPPLSCRQRRLVWGRGSARIAGQLLFIANLSIGILTLLHAT